MDTRELHIGIDLELQQINSSITTNIQPQEKDWFINKEVLKYINRKLSGNGTIGNDGFQDTAKRIDDIRELVRTKTRPIVINSEGKGVVSLPSDYYKHIRTDIYLAKDCGNPVVEAKEKIYRVEMPIEIDADSFQSFQVRITLDSGEKTLMTEANLPADYLKSLDFKKQKFMLIKALKIILPKELKKHLNDDFDLYWEFDKDNYIANTFVLYSTKKLHKASVKFNNSTKNYFPSDTSVNAFTSNKYPKLSNVRVIDEEFYSDSVNSHLSKSKPSSLTSHIIGQNLIVDIPKGVVVGRARVVYICVPTLADILLNSNINMSRNSLDEILVNTVAYLKAVVQSDNYSTYKQETILVE